MEGTQIDGPQTKETNKPRNLLKTRQRTVTGMLDRGKSGFRISSSEFLGFERFGEAWATSGRWSKGYSHVPGWNVILNDW